MTRRRAVLPAVLLIALAVSPRALADVRPVFPADANRPSPWTRVQLLSNSLLSNSQGVAPARSWRSLDFGAIAPRSPLGLPSADLFAAAADDAQTPRPRAKAFEYSDAYNLRRKIHFYASFATLPLFAAEYAVGQKLYNGTGGESMRSAHQTLAASIGVLFGVNTVTGVWNLWEARQDPNHRTKRMVHGILMLAADAGFVATGLLAPSEEEHFSGNYASTVTTHRTVALTSMATAVAGYVMMLVGR